VVAIEPFLTAYDPSDLPGASIDPLGFDRGYQFLAESLLPGLTNVASRPRYWSVLCAGLTISDEAASGAETLKQRTSRRRSAVQRLERFWALACVRASDRTQQALPSGGIRGLRYVQREVARQGDVAERTDGGYKLLARQLQYGLVGIYGAGAERLRLIDRDFGIHPELGSRLGQAFIEETRLPADLRKALADGREVKLSDLTSWGERAHHSLPVRGREGASLRAAFDQDLVRRRVGELLLRFPRSAETSELVRLDGIRLGIVNDESNRDLLEVLAAILSFERCFRALSLGFYRLLWLVQRGGELDLSGAATDHVVGLALDELQRHAGALDSALTGSTCLRGGAGRWSDSLNCVKDAAETRTAEQFVRSLVSRHGDVQRGKFDRGLRKTPWIEFRSSTIHLTLSQAQHLGREPETLDDMSAHEYRTLSAERLLGVAS
jgi:hypothetical protein